jgi:ABC-type sugar transport system permease subunit
MLFNKDTGLINWVLANFGVAKIDWLFSPQLCIPLMVIVSFWQWTGYHMVYLLAAIQAIDPTIYEVAKLDGASPLRTMFQITLPLIRPAIMFVIITSAIGGMRQFEYSFMLFPNAGYGPGMKAMTGVPFIYYYGFSNNFELGLATAAGWLLFLIILVIVLIQIKTIGLGQAEEY